MTVHLEPMLSSENCCICLESMEGEAVRGHILPPAAEGKETVVHCFHEACIQQMAKKTDKLCCPLCRAEIDKKSCYPIKPWTERIFKRCTTAAIRVAGITALLSVYNVGTNVIACEKSKVAYCEFLSSMVGTLLTSGAVLLAVTSAVVHAQADGETEARRVLNIKNRKIYAYAVISSAVITGILNALDSRLAVAPGLADGFKAAAAYEATLMLVNR